MSASVGRDIKTGLLLPPPPKGVHPASAATKVVKIDQLPGSVVAHAYPTLMAAAASTAPRRDDGDEDAPPKSEAPDGSGLTGVAIGEPLRAAGMRTRVWAMYAEESGARAAFDALAKLPQLSELAEEAPTTVETFAPPVEEAPADLTEEAAGKHCERCEEIVSALEARLDTRGACKAALGDAAERCSAAQKLQLLTLYLRRVHCFDYPSGRLLPSQADLLHVCGDAQPASKLVMYDGREADVAFALPLHWPSGPTEFAAESFLKLTRELNKLDESFDRAVTEATETFFKDNCVEEEPGKFRCPLSNKLFKDPVYVRKHIENKHAADVLKVKAKPLDKKYLEYFLAIASLTPPPKQRPRPQFRERRNDVDNFGRQQRRDSFDRRDSFEGGRGKGFGKGEGSPFGRGKGKGKGEGSPFGKGGGKGGGPPSELDGRRVMSYKDLDAPDDDDALFA